MCVRACMCSERPLFVCACNEKRAAPALLLLLLDAELVGEGFKI